MPEARIVRGESEQRIVVENAVAVGEVWQMGNGEAAVFARLAEGAEQAASTGEECDFRSDGKWTIEKTTGINFLDGGRVYWDHSANKAHYKKVNDRDFYIGRSVGDHGVNDATLVVDLNKDPRYDIDALRDGFLSVVTGTQALGGFGYPKDFGGSKSIELTATSEVQKVDILSVDGFSKDANAIVEAIFRVADDGAGTAADFSIGAANGTHGTDADAITEHCFCHLDANATAINLQSKDGTTTVTATDSTYTYTQGSAVANRVEIWMDFRVPASVKIYVNGVRALAAITFNLDNIASTIFLLAHLEKTSSADVYRAIVDALRARFMEQ